MEEKKQDAIIVDQGEMSSWNRTLCEFSAEEARSRSRMYSYFYGAMTRIRKAAGEGKRHIEIYCQLTQSDVDRIEAMGYTIFTKEDLDEITNIYETVKITW